MKLEKIEVEYIVSVRDDANIIHQLRVHDPERLSDIILSITSHQLRLTTFDREESDPRDEGEYSRFMREDEKGESVN